VAELSAAETERALRARVAELEARLEARTQVVVTMGARLAEIEGGAPAPVAERLRAVERELEQLRSTKVLRWAAWPRRIYAGIRRRLGEGRP
jgi:type VI protein secretion system component VasK